MDPYIDIKNPLVILISVVSITPSILAILLIDTFLPNSNFLIILTIITLPIFVLYYVLWKIYKKSKHYQERYG